MKTSSHPHRTLIVCILIVAGVTAVPAADLGIGNKASQFAPRGEKRAGFFSRLFGPGARTSKSPDRDDDDDGQRDRDDDDNHSPRSAPPLREMTAPQGRTVVIRTTSTARVPTNPRHLDTYRMPLVQAPIAVVAPPKPESAAPARLTSRRALPLIAPVTTEVRIENSTTSAPERGVIGTVVTPAQPTEPVHPAPLAVASKSMGGVASEAPPLATVANSEKPASPPPPPFGKPVPGRAGLVYVPGLKETTENMLDVRDIAPGTKVRDPVSKTVFLVP